MQAEFRMITDLATVTPKELRFNYDELKAVLQENLAQYKTQIVTPDTISEARADRAKLNKLKDGISSYRISVKKQLMEQYDTDFKPKCDELVEMVDEAASNIGGQIKAYEEAEANAKIERIRQYYVEACTDDLREFCPWEAVFNLKWANKGYSEDNAREEIGAALNKTEADLGVIRTMDERDVPYLLDVYKQARDLGAVMRKAAELKARREAEEKRKAELDAALRAAKENQAPRVIDAADPDAFAKAKPGDVISFGEAAKSAEDEIVTVDFRVECSKRQLASLKGFLRANGIRYGRVP